MSKLETLIASIVTDLINARFEADVTAAELAERYRDDATMRALNAPTLNIKNVSIDLRVAFDENPIEETDEQSEDQKKAIADGSAAVRDSIMKLAAVKNTIPGTPQRRALSRSLGAAVTKALSETLRTTGRARRARIEGDLTKLLTQNRVRLSPADMKVLRREIDRAGARIATARRLPPKSVPGVMVGGESLAKLDPAAISSIRFDVDLSGKRWADVEDEDGTTRTVLSDD